MKSLFLSIVFLMLGNTLFAADKIICFPTGTNLNAVERHIRPILLPRDGFRKNLSSNCIYLQIEEKRHELFEKYIRMKFRIKETYSSGASSSASFDKRMCRLEVETVSRKRSRSRIGGAQKNQVYANEDLSKGISRSVSQIMVSSGRSAAIIGGESNVQVKCTVLNNNQYRLELSSSGNGNSLQTTVSLSRGQKLEIGSLLQNSNTGANQGGVSIDTSGRAGIGGSVSSSKSNSAVKQYIYIK